MKKFTVEFNLMDDQFALLGKWASVSRTLKEAMRIMEEVNTDSLSKDENECIDACYSELKDIEPALSTLHAQVREVIWKINAEGKS